MTMTMATSIHMPGSFLPGSDVDHSSPTFHCTPFKSSVFLPPNSDGSVNSSTFLPTSKTGGVTSHAPHSRKRARLHTEDSRRQSSLYDSALSSGFDVPSPSPFIQTDYRFANGLDTSVDLNAQREDLEREHDYERDCRPNRYDRQVSSRQESNYLQTPSSADGMTSNTLRYSSSPRPGWSTTVLSLAGGVAGKVLSFCWNSAVSFKGFYAGGGKGYSLDTGSPSIVGSGWSHIEPTQDVFAAEYKETRTRYARGATPVPGGFPEDHQPSIRRARREDNRETPTMQNSNVQPGFSDMRNNWVMVDGFDSSSRETSPVRKKSRASLAGASIASNPTRTGSTRGAHNNLGVNGRPRLTSRSSTHRSSASFASPRSLHPSTGKTSHQSRPSLPHFATTHDDHNTSSTRRPTSRASLASPRRQSSFNPTNHNVTTASAMTHNPSPQSPEVRKFQQKLRRKEAHEDESMARLNEQLKAMIKEGKQALGSKIEIDEYGDGEGEGDEDEEVDEGYEEGVIEWDKGDRQLKSWS